MATKLTNMATIFQLLVLASSTIMVLILQPNLSGATSIGVCYRMNGHNMSSPQEVVKIYRSNQIGRMRLYEPNHSIFEALRGSGIQVLIGVRDRDIEQLSISYPAARDWVDKNIRPYWPDVHFRYIAVGNEAIPGDLAPFVLPAMQNLHTALSSGGLWHRIKVSTVVSTAIFGVTFPPSYGSFSDCAVSYMAPIARYLHAIGAPLLANVYPYFRYVQNPSDMPLEYALLSAKSVVFQDSGFGYRSLFDEIVDAFYASLEKVGASNVRLVVSETGWASYGDNKVATTQNAWLYTSNVVRHVLALEGSPRRPRERIETYLFSMFDEDRKMGEASENHFGLFFPDGRPVYPIEFH